MENELIDAVIEQIKDGVNNGDVTAIEELLRFVPEINLIGFLPEQDWSNHDDHSEQLNIRMKYMTATDTCPYCGSTNLEGGGHEPEGSGLFHPITCTDCDKDWEDSYVLTDMVVK